MGGFGDPRFSHFFRHFFDAKFGMQVGRTKIAPKNKNVPTEPPEGANIGNSGPGSVAWRAPVGGGGEGTNIYLNIYLHQC